MNRRKPELQAIDLATWPGIAWTDLDTEALKVIRQRMRAPRMPSSSTAPASDK
jgi:putative transposase